MKIICEILTGEKPKKIIVTDGDRISIMEFRNLKGSQCVLIPRRKNAFLCWANIQRNVYQPVKDK